MNFYNEIKNKTSEEIKEIVQNRIIMMEENSYENDVLGFDTDLNFQKKYITSDNQYDEVDVELYCYSNNFIKKNTKVVYSMVYALSGENCCFGNYYYVDTYDYIFEFCDFIKDKVIIDDYEFLEYVYDFLKIYFGIIPTQNSISKIQGREEMFTLLVDNNNSNIKPKREHGLSWFKKNCNALCTEYSLIAHNILKFFDIDSHILIGKIDFNDEITSHAFNILSTKSAKHDLLLDFTLPVKVYDADFEEIGKSPFTARIPKIDDEYLSNIIDGKEHLKIKDYHLMIINNSLFRLTSGVYRDYFISYGLTEYTYKKN